jgi:hypothetical protein
MSEPSVLEQGWFLETGFTEVPALLVFSPEPPAVLLVTRSRQELSTRPEW